MGIEDKSRLVIISDGQEIADRVIYCCSRESRRNGLLGRYQLDADEGILMQMPEIRRGKVGLVNSIHMLGMRFPIAVAWLDQEGIIVHSLFAKRWRPYYGTSHPSWYILEVHPSKLPFLSNGTGVHWKVWLPE